LVVASVAFGVLFASLLLFIGFDHNPQGEFFDPQSGEIDWGYSALLFSVWFTVGSLAAAALLFTARLLVSGVRKQLRKGPGP
jgi:hypothetical protein